MSSTDSEVHVEIVVGEPTHSRQLHLEPDASGLQPELRNIGSFRLRYVGDTTVRRGHEPLAPLSALAEEPQREDTDFETDVGSLTFSTANIYVNTNALQLLQTEREHAQGEADPGQPQNTHDSDTEGGVEPQESTPGAGDLQEEEIAVLPVVPPEREPVLDKYYRRRAVQTLQDAVSQAAEVEVEKEEPTVLGSCKECLAGAQCKCPNSFSGDIPTLSPDLESARQKGLGLMKKLLLPALPRVLQDIWVYTELAVTTYQLAFAIVSISLKNNRGFNILYLLLTILGFTFALIDGFIYFFQAGTCLTCFRYYCFRNKSSEEESAKEKNEKGDSERKWWRLSAKWIGKFTQWLDLIRNIITELIIYPLLICDMYDFIATGSYQRRDASERINFSLFVVGSFYLILSVYFMRAFIVISAVVTLRRTPYDSSGVQRNYINFVTNYCLNILAQLVVHAVIIATIGVKIHQENPNSCSPDNNCPDGITSSPFLIYSAIAGGIIPLLSIVAFFVANYYEFQQLSIGLWTDMVSLLQGESFAALVFQGEGVKVAKQKAQKFFKKSNIVAMKKQISEIKPPSFWKKVVLAFRYPFLIVLGILYELLIISFIVCLLFTKDSGGVRFNAFEQGLSSIFFIVACLLLCVNFQVLFLTTAWILLILVVGMLIILIPVFIVFYLIPVFFVLYLILVVPDYVKSKLF